MHQIDKDLMQISKKLNRLDPWARKHSDTSYTLLSNKTIVDFTTEYIHLSEAEQKTREELKDYLFDKLVEMNAEKLEKVAALKQAEKYRCQARWELIKELDKGI